MISMPVNKRQAPRDEMMSDADVVEPVFCIHSTRLLQLRVVPGGWVGEKVPLIGDSMCHQKRKRIAACLFILNLEEVSPFFFPLKLDLARVAESPPE